MMESITFFTPKSNPYPSHYLLTLNQLKSICSQSCPYSETSMQSLYNLKASNPILDYLCVNQPRVVFSVIDNSMDFWIWYWLSPSNWLAMACPTFCSSSTFISMEAFGLLSVFSVSLRATFSDMVWYRSRPSSLSLLFWWRL